MEAHARAPDPLTKSADMANNWHSWIEDFIIFMKVTGYIDKPNEIRANLLKNRIGKVGLDAIQNISFDNPQDKDDMDILVAKLEDFFNPPKNEMVERYQFFTRAKKQNESIEQYISSLREKAKTCNFADMTDSIIRDKIILDTNDKILRKKFFETDKLDLQKIVAIYNDYNINIEKMKQVSKENKIEKDNTTKDKKDNITKDNKTEPPSAAQKSATNQPKKNCWRCGQQHPPGKCPAWGSKCTKCGDINHFTHLCKGKSHPKANNDKTNQNLLDPTQSQAKVFPKNNDKLWNNRSKSTATTVDPVNKMFTSLPDVPKVSYGAVSSASSNDITSDFVLLDAHNMKSSSSQYNSTMNRSAYLPKNASTNYTNSNAIKQQSNTAHTFQKPEDNIRNIQNQYVHWNAQRYKHNQNKKSDGCILS